MRNLAVIVTMLFLFAFEAVGVRSVPYPVKVFQPDGSYLMLRIHGDESFSYKTTLDGYIVAQATDGYYYYADYNNGALNISARRVDGYPTGGYAKSIPPIKYHSKRHIVSESFKNFLAPDVATKAVRTIRTVVIPVQFSDLKFMTQSIRSRLFNLFNQINYSEDGATGSVREYFRDNLGDRYELTFEITDPVTLPNGYRYYGERTATSSDNNVKEMVGQASALVDSKVNFANFDADGDGVVDNVFIIFAGYNEAEGGGDATIWPQSWNVSSLELYFDGKKISNFSCYSEFSGSSGEKFAGIGSICHEYCHMLGLLDMYDVNGDTEGYSPLLLGPLSIMDNGNYNNGGKTPPYLTVFEREMLGAVSPSRLYGSTSIEVLPVHQETRAYIIPAYSNGESFYLEYRDGLGWDAHIGGEGLVIYHIDKSYGSACSMSAKMRWNSNAVNACASHPCVRPIASSGNSYTDISMLFFPGKNSVTHIHSSYSFPLLDWSGKGHGYGIANIHKGSAGMLLDIIADNGWDSPVVKEYSIEPQQRTALLKWSTDKEESRGNWNIVWSLENSVYADTSVVSVTQRDYLFTDLKPGSTYNCRLFYSRNNVIGKSYPMSFSTREMFSLFPMIADMDKSYKAGDEVHLTILNIAEEVISIRWIVNGAEVPDGKLKFDRSGLFEIKAEISYPDNSVEYIVKKKTISQ